MSVNRLFHWICDNCKKEIIKEGYGLPKKWIYLPVILGKDKIEHRCNICKDAEL